VETPAVNLRDGLGEQYKSRWFDPGTAPVIRPAAIAVLSVAPVSHRSSQPLCSPPAQFPAAAFMIGEALIA
jgi:hypothetical protein